MKKILAGVLAIAFLTEDVVSQEIRGGGNPYSSQLMTDPDAGTIQGIQRYGRPMATDPAQGNGYPYYVFPSVRDLSRPSPFGGNPTATLGPQQQLQLQQKLRQVQSLGVKAADLRGKSQEVPSNDSASNNPDNTKSLSLNPADKTKETQDVPPKGISTLGGIFSSPSTFSSASDYSALASPQPSPVFIPGRGIGTDSTTAYIRHQPLVQIKLRVVEVTRNNSLNASSTLDYISNIPGLASEFGTATGVVPNLNNSQRNLSGGSRFPGASGTGLLSVNNDAVATSNLTSGLNSGAGALVNLTSEHINLITSLLAEELQADVLTAPELVTTNGESVEFVAGTKSPFNLGTVTTNAGAVTAAGLEAGRVQNNVFYKHVGTYLKVTPRIVNLGSNGTGNGEKAIVSGDVLDWNLLIKFLLNEGLAFSNAEILKKVLPTDIATANAQPHVWEAYTRSGRLVPLDTKTIVLECVNRFSRSELHNYVLQRTQSNSDYPFDFAEIVQGCEDGNCDWKPEDCTIDLEVLARFSNAGNAPASTSANLAGADIIENATFENGVRAIANIVQIKNGTGVVMAGLLGESDVESVAKIPVLGDLPGVGFLFRSKSVARNKSEIVIFIEAKVLSDDACLARSESSEDLQLTKPFVTAGTLDNPLETGLHRAGMGTYLPPASCEERDYWERNARRINRIKTTTHDALR